MPGNLVGYMPQFTRVIIMSRMVEMMMVKMMMVKMIMGLVMMTRVVKMVLKMALYMAQSTRSVISRMMTIDQYDRC